MQREASQQKRWPFGHCCCCLPQRRSGVEHVSWFAPAGCREQTSAELWNRAEAAEKRKNSTVAREVLAALPHELNQFQRRELVERMTAQLAGRYGVAGTAGIHAPDREGDQRNWHVHILMTTRRIDPATGDQGIDRAPTTHEGPRVTAIRRECEREQRDPLGACDVIELNDARRLPPLAELRAESQQLEAEIIDLSQRRQERALRREVGELGRALAEPEPRCIAVAKAQKRQVEQRLQDAKQWHQEHPIRSALSSWAGIEPRADREAEAAREAYNASEARREAIRWQEQRAKDQQRLQEARSELLEAPGVADAADRLENASRALRRAEGLSENHATRAVLDERAALHQERTQMRELRQEIEAARERVPTRAEAQELEQRAGQHLGRMEGWEQIEQQRQAEARQELERRAAESVRDRQEARQAGPRNGGPKLG